MHGFFHGVHYGSRKDDPNQLFFLKHFLYALVRKLSQSDIGRCFFEIRRVNHIVYPYKF